MSIFNVFSLLGGLALFLSGMDTMGKALEQQAGSHLQTILRRLSDNRIKGFLLGLVVTAIIQSSSATTVMVVGFVNSGIMQLSQAIGIIMGANVGTTITAWLLSLAGIRGDSLFLKLLKPSNFSPILAFIGVCLSTGSKQEKLKNLGSILLGFAVLMIGMNTMSTAVAPLGNVPAFTNLFLLFQNPLLGLLVGAVLTSIIQSSSASVGILQALALSTGAVTFGSAIPIIMGQNIGTCITAMLSSIGTNKNARRTALVHLYFNIIGAVGLLTIFYLLNAFFHFSFVSAPINATGIAIVHTAFNIIATACLLPFTKQLETLAYMTIPETKATNQVKENFQLLDPRLLNTPSVALERTAELTCTMAELSRTAFLKAQSLLVSWDDTRSTEVCHAERTLDTYEDKIGSYLIQLSHRQMSSEDSQTISTLFYAISDWERIGDYALHIKMTAEEMHINHHSFSPDAQEELRVIEQAVQEVMDKTIQVCTRKSCENGGDLAPLNHLVGELAQEIRERHILRLKSERCDMSSGILLNDLLNDLQRISAHCSSIALRTIQQGRVERHAYRQQFRTDEDFQKKYQQYCRLYRLASL